MKKLFAFLLCLTLTQAHAAQWLPLFQQTSGGSGPVIAVALAGTVPVGGASPLIVATGVTFPTGEAVCAAAQDRGGGADPSITGLSIDGTPLTLSASGIQTDGTNINVGMWFGTITSGTHTITAISTGNFSLVAVTCWSITGLTSSTPTASVALNGTVSIISDPQGPLPSLTVPSAGVSVVVAGGDFKSATVLPLVWTPSPAVVRDATTEVIDTSGNSIMIGGAHITTAGTYTGACAGGSGGVCVSGGSSSMSFSAQLGLAFH